MAVVFTRKRIFLAVFMAVTALGIVFVVQMIPRDKEMTGVMETSAHFVGSQQCEGCHQQETEHWKQSDHHRAMEHASEKSVLGNFNNTEFNYFGRKTKFTNSGGQYFVTTENQQGKIENFTVAYTLGYKPLQQYLVTFPDGRIQTLPFAWDTRAREKGGQRWFHLYPDEDIKPENPLFWTRPLQNWNHMCADCHTTDFAKNFSDKDNRFNSHWQEVGNGCESCHGAGSAHVALMQKKTPATKNDFSINALEKQNEQMNQCGACHSRRDRLRVNPSHEQMGQTYKPVLLQEGLYFADGQIHDEVFITSSFMQSKMYAAGVTCSNCHDPHTTKLKAEGNSLCTQCHIKETYDTEKHYFHPANTAGALCVSCHMPTRTYMVVDPRHDHRFSIPRPDLSETINVPNPCVTCHQDNMKQNGKDNHWAAGKIRQHLHAIGKNENPPPHFAETFWRARHEQLFTNTDSGHAGNAGPYLEKIISDEKTNSIIKASALMELANYMSPSALQLVAEQLQNADAMVRLGAVESLNGAAPEQRTGLLMGVINDPSRAVRMAAAPMLMNINKAPTAANNLSATELKSLNALLAEYKSLLETDSDRATALVNLASFYLAQGDRVNTQGMFEKALQRDDTSLAAYLNYADYYRSVNNEPGAEKLLRKALAIYPDSADAHYALGLLLVRANNYVAALNQLEQAQKLAPQQSQYAYIYGIGLYSSGKQEQGLAVLAKAQRAFPANTQILSALVSYYAERKDMSRAQDYSAKLQALMAP